MSKEDVHFICMFCLIIIGVIALIILGVLEPKPQQITQNDKSGINFKCGYVIGSGFKCGFMID